MLRIKYYLIIVLLSFTNISTAEEKILAEIPDFFLEGPSNTKVRLSSLKGQVVLINFWASWCHPCRVEMPVLEKFYKRYGDDGLTILGINIENTRQPTKEKNIVHLIKEMAITFPILYDSDKNVMHNIEKHLLKKNMGMPTTLFIDRQGNTRHIHEGYRKSDNRKYQEMIEFLLNEPKKETVVQ